MDARPGQARGDPRPPRLAERRREDARARAGVPRARARRAHVLRRRAARHGRLEPVPRRAAQHLRRRSRATRSCTCSTRPTRRRSSASARRSSIQDTLFIVASKSGETTETLSHFAYFWGQVNKNGRERRGRPALRRDHRPRHVAREAGEGARLPLDLPQPARHRRPLLGAELLRPGARRAHRRRTSSEMLERAVEMAHSCADSVPADKNPGVWLGAVMGELAARRPQQAHADRLAEGRDLRLLGRAAHRREHRQAGQGHRARRGRAGRQARRLRRRPAVRLHPHGRATRRNRAVQALEKAGQPVVTLTLRDKLDLGGEFLRWEIATAIAGSILRHRRLRPAERAGVEGQHQEGAGAVQEQGQAAAGGVDAGVEARRAGSRRCSSSAKPGAYFAIMAYTTRTPASEAAIAAIRTAVRDRKHIATTAGLRAALPALDRPAAQGRPARPACSCRSCRTTPRTCRFPASRSASRSSSRRSRWATCSRSPRAACRCCA